MDQSNTKFITINEVHFQNTKLKFKNPLEVSITKDITSEYLFTGENDEINLCVFADTLEGLKEEIYEQVAMVWDEYVRPDPKDFTSAALTLRARLM